MPRIFDNIDHKLLPALQTTLHDSHRADFCVGYFNLRGWKGIDGFLEGWDPADGSCCRLLVGMQRLPHDELRAKLGLLPDGGMDNQTAIRLKARMAEEFRRQLTIGAPTRADREGLLRLKAQLESGRLVVRLFLAHPLHAKLYLAHKRNEDQPRVGYIGSSNLTFAGLSSQGELNVDVVEHDATWKVATWFDERWNNRWCLDITKELAAIIDESWVTPVSPYEIYIKMAYHLSQEARAGVADTGLPNDLKERLFAFQAAAVKIAARHLNTRGGVLIGDVVGLGKTLMATALARIRQDDYGDRTLILCPKNLVGMWRDYVHEYDLNARVLSITQVANELPGMKRYRLVIIDESHNLRNREGQRFRIIQEYIGQNDSKVVLLSATPYNKSYGDLGAQLRLFVDEGEDLGIRPERLLREMGELQFNAKHQARPTSLAAFEKSEYPDDWRELMRLYMVRRTRSFILEHYASEDADGRRYLLLADGSPSYFPKRVPRTLTFSVDDRDRGDQYARLYSDPVVEAINSLNLPRYGLGNYARDTRKSKPSKGEQAQLENLGRAVKRLMGFCRTNLFKRLESGGPAFIQSVERHLLRNYVFIHAIEQGLPLPLGTQDVELLDSGISDRDDAISNYEMDEESPASNIEPGGDLPNDLDVGAGGSGALWRERAARVYADYRASYGSRFRWLRPELFEATLLRDLQTDADTLAGVLDYCGAWDAARDNKLRALEDLLTTQHPKAKVLIFTQFADTVGYLTKQLKVRGIAALEGVTGSSENPTALAHRFSPASNGKRGEIGPGQELRVMIATDVLSEGQNLQDCHVIVNYDLPWAIIRLVQRAGRVDRIGQSAPEILCYSFLPAEGVESLIRLRARVNQRLQENAEVLGGDETFFEGDMGEQAIRDLYTEKSGILEGGDDGEVDLASYAYQIWKNAVDADPSLERRIPKLQHVVSSARSHSASAAGPEGALVYLRTTQDNDALAWVDTDGRPVTQSQLAILQAAACHPHTPMVEPHPEHDELVRRGVEHLLEETSGSGGQLGRPSGARYRAYTRLKAYSEDVQGTLFDTPELRKAVQEIYDYPLLQSATDALNRLMRDGATDEQLAERVVELSGDNRLCHISEDETVREPQIICSLGLVDVVRGEQ